MKKQWEQPKLIVLARSSPEESLIIWCKGGTIPGDPIGDFSFCYEMFSVCSACNYWGTS